MSKSPSRSGLRLDLRRSVRRLLGAARAIAAWAERRPLTLSIIALLITALACWLMASFAGYAAVESVLGRFDARWLALVLGARIAAFAGYTLAHASTLTRRRESVIPTTTRMKLVAFGSSATSLGGGFSIDYRAIRRAGATPREAIVRVLSLGALEWATLAPVAWVCALTLLDSPRVQRAVTVPWAIGVPLGGLLAAIAVWRLSPRALVRKGGAARGLGRGMEALAALPKQFRDRALGSAGVLGMGLYWAAEIASLWAAMRTFGVHPGIAVAALGYATGHVLTPRSLPLSGAGITEILLPLSLRWVGVALAASVAAVLTYRLCLIGLSIPPALIAREEVQQLVRAGGVRSD
jgi:uncharacterized membrane protein YbhN (UPF0104 family)